MIFDLAVVSLSARGVQVAVRSTDDAHAFWLPRHHPAIVWSKPPEPGEPVTVRLPSWVVEKHGQLRQLRFQRSINFYAPIPMDPVKSKESLPMAYDNNMTGALFKNDRRENDRQPLYKGSCEINGHKFWISAWLKDGKSGKFMSLAFKPAEEQQRAQPEPQNTYASAGAKRAPAGGPTFDGEDSIPFGPQVL